MILSLEHLKSIENKFNKEALKYRKVYLQMLFDCFNEALNYVRPYETEGVPPTWSIQTMQIIGNNYLVDVLCAVADLIGKWWGEKIGPIGSVATDKDWVMGVDNCEKGWTCYEDEEIQVVCHSADAIMRKIVEELVEILDLS